MGRQARYVVQKAEGIDGDPIPADEPCIVIRGQDVLALKMIDYYLQQYAEMPGADDQVVAELEQHQDAITAWQRDHAHAVKIADR